MCSALSAPPIHYHPLPKLEELSLEEKVGQLLMVCFKGQTAENAQLLIENLNIGAIIYYQWSNDLESLSPAEVHALSQALQDTSKIPLLIAVDQEGGAVTRLKRGFTVFPGNGELGAIGNPELVRHSCFTRGQELRSVGVNLNLAPVLDVNNNPKNPVIGPRSFGDDPLTVSELGAAAIQGYQQAGLLCTAKHWPGHGNTEKDSHLELPVIFSPLEELQRCELLPFRKVADCVDVIMTAHLMVPAIDPSTCITLSARAISLLRSHFSGVILSDSLTMSGVLGQSAIEEVAIQALIAGHDMLCLGGQLLREEKTRTNKRRDRSYPPSDRRGSEK